MSRLRRLERLLRKYEELHRLRERREELEASGATCFEAAEGAVRKRAFRRIAREFPGALRELDTVAAPALAARRERVRAARDRCAAGLPPSSKWVFLRPNV